MLIRSERGPGTLMYCRGPETYYDPTNPEARKFCLEQGKRELLQSWDPKFLAG